MLENFLTVGEQVLILFILICIGAITGKCGIIKRDAIPSINSFILYFVAVSVIIKSFYRDFDVQMFKGLGIAALLAVLTHVLNIVIAHLFIHDKERKKECVLRFASVFSNCGFMAIPLQTALLGDRGVFFGAVYIAVFNIACWTYGLILMSGDKKNLSAKKIFVNPGVIGVSLGMLLFLTSVKLPEVVYMPISYLAALNTPLPMIVIGFMLWEIFSSGIKEIKGLLTNGKLYLAMIIRIVIVPLMMFAIMSLLQIERTIMLSILICASAPVAAMTSMFAEKFGGDEELSVTAVSISTILSLITMPVIISMAM